MSVHDPTAGRIPDGAVIVWQQDDGRWRWRWTFDVGAHPDGGDEDESLVSNEAYDSLDEACTRAKEAFPGAVLRRPESPTETRHRHRRRRGWLVLAGAALVVAGRRSPGRRRRDGGDGRAAARDGRR